MFWTIWFIHENSRCFFRVRSSAEWHLVTWKPPETESIVAKVTGVGRVWNMKVTAQKSGKALDEQQWVLTSTVTG